MTVPSDTAGYESNFLSAQRSTLMRPCTGLRVPRVPVRASHHHHPPCAQKRAAGVLATHGFGVLTVIGLGRSTRLSGFRLLQETGSLGVPLQRASRRRCCASRFSALLSFDLVLWPMPMQGKETRSGTALHCIHL